jgi:adenylate cyclase
MDEEVAGRAYADPLVRWFVTEAYKIADTGELVAASGEQLVKAGIPVYRLAYFQLTLHPELDGKAYLWRRDRQMQVQTAAVGLKDRPAFRDNPMATVFRERKTLRVRLEATEPEAPVLRQFKAEGATDYVALPLPFGSGHVDGLSVISDRRGGFSTTDLDRILPLQFPFARIVESHSLRDTATYLLDAYVGRAAGQRILAGEIKRGSGRTIEAVLWYCDLRGFTRASDTLPRDTVINLLNDYFDVMGKIVIGAGGEIVKFMGDGMLGMFPVASPAKRAQVASNVVRAAGSVADAITVLNGIRAAADEPAVRFGLALHIGEVMFGNIGVSNRLDFTVIGPAVNHAARLEKLCVPLSRPVLLSAALAALLPARDIEALGLHALKDVGQPQAIFGLCGAGGWNLP